MNFLPQRLERRREGLGVIFCGFSERDKNVYDNLLSS